jgi:predicted double-glycine peptidase
MEQGYDTSCGMSVVATALDRYWGVLTDEVDLIGSLLRDKPENDVYTVSLAEMAIALEARGVAAWAFRLDWEGLAGLIGKGCVPFEVYYANQRKVRGLVLWCGLRNAQA